MHDYHGNMSIDKPELSEKNEERNHECYLGNDPGAQHAEENIFRTLRLVSFSGQYVSRRSGQGKPYDGGRQSYDQAVEAVFEKIALTPYFHVIGQCKYGYELRRIAEGVHLGFQRKGKGPDQGE